MRATLRTLVGLLLTAFVWAGVAANPAFAQEKGKAAQAEKGKVISTVLAENDKVRVVENRFKPGDVSESPASGATRVVRFLQGGTLLRTYADGKTEKTEWNTGETQILAPSAQAYTTKNVGTTEVVAFLVILK